MERYSGMWPILKTEYCNAIYVKDMLLGEPVDPVAFDNLHFKEGSRPARPGGAGVAPQEA
jgi:hypothetical protein